MFDFEKASRRALSGGLFGDMRFTDAGALCRVCKSPLEIHYCEERVYAVRCRLCMTITLVMANRPNQASLMVGNAHTGAESEGTKG